MLLLLTRVGTFDPTWRGFFTNGKLSWTRMKNKEGYELPIKELNWLLKLKEWNYFYYFYKKSKKQLIQMENGEFGPTDEWDRSVKGRWSRGVRIKRFECGGQKVKTCCLTTGHHVRLRRPEKRFGSLMVLKGIVVVWLICIGRQHLVAEPFRKRKKLIFEISACLFVSRFNKSLDVDTTPPPAYLYEQSTSGILTSFSLFSHLS